MQQRQRDETPDERLVGPDGDVLVNGAPAAGEHLPKLVAGAELDLP